MKAKQTNDKWIHNCPRRPFLFSSAPCPSTSTLIASTPRGVSCPTDDTRMAIPTRPLCKRRPAPSKHPRTNHLRSFRAQTATFQPLDRPNGPLEPLHLGPNAPVGGAPPPPARLGLDPGVFVQIHSFRYHASMAQMAIQRVR